MCTSQGESTSNEYKEKGQEAVCEEHRDLLCGWLYDRVVYAVKKPLMLQHPHMWDSHTITDYSEI